MQRIVLRDTCIGVSAACKASSVMISSAEEGKAHAPSISADGRAVTFVSEASGSQTGLAAGMRIYLWREGSEASALIAETSAGEGAALPEGNARFSAPVSANGAVAAVYSVTTPREGVAAESLSGKGDVFLLDLDQ